MYKKCVPLRDAPKNAPLNVTTHFPQTKAREYIFTLVFPLNEVLKCVVLSLYQTNFLKSIFLKIKEAKYFTSLLLFVVLFSQ